MIILPPELITLIIEASFNQSNPYLVVKQCEDLNVFHRFSLVSQKFRKDARRFLVNSLNLTEKNIDSIKETLVGMFDEEEESLVRFIRRIYVGEFVKGTANLLDEALNLEELWIDCSGSTGVSLILDIPKSIHTLHLHSKTRGRWLDLSRYASTVYVTSLNISTTFISPLFYAAFPNLTTLSVLIEHSCNIAPDHIVDIFERIGSQLIRLQILQYGRHLSLFPYHSFSFLTNLQHFSISGSDVIPHFLNEIPSRLISLRYVNSYSDYLPHKLVPLPYCLGKVQRVGFPVQVTDGMKGKIGLDEWAGERGVKLVELELRNGLWQEDLELLLNW